jgi:hypothetical protein
MGHIFASFGDTSICPDHELVRSRVYGVAPARVRFRSGHGCARLVNVHHDFDRIFSFHDAVAVMFSNRVAVAFNVVNFTSVHFWKCQRICYENADKNAQRPPKTGIKIANNIPCFPNINSRVLC